MVLNLTATIANFRAVSAVNFVPASQVREDNYLYGSSEALPFHFQNIPVTWMFVRAEFP